MSKQKNTAIRAVLVELYICIILAFEEEFLIITQKVNLRIN
jgi:hypothetical protein